MFIFSSASILSIGTVLLLVPHKAVGKTWQEYVIPPPPSTIKAVAVANHSSTGITNPTAFLISGKTRVNSVSAAELTQRIWPAGTIASATSTLAKSGATTYIPSNAIDGDETTFWQDATPNVSAYLHK